MKKNSLYLLLALVLLGSCYTSKQANKDLNKANEKYPTEVAKFTREHFPCTIKDTTILSDTLYKYLSVICPPDTSLTDTIYLDKITRVPSAPVIKTRVIAIPSKTITITNSVEDSAQIKIITADRDRISQALETYRTRMEKKSEWIKWLLIALIVSLLGNFILLYTRKP